MTNEVEEAQKEQYRVLVVEAMLNAQTLQKFLWDRLDYAHQPFDLERWVEFFQKRVDKIREVDITHPNWKVEIRKRLLQQAALSIQAIIALKDIGNENGK